MKQKRLNADFLASSDKIFSWKTLKIIFWTVVVISLVGRLAIAHIPFGGWDDYNETNYSGASRNLLHGKGSLWGMVNVEDNVIYEVTPLLMYILFFVYKLFGSSEFVSRLVPIFFSTATVLFVYLLGKYLFNRSLALIACIFLLTNSMFTMYGFIVQTDSVYIFFMIASFYYYVRYCSEGKLRMFIIAGILNSCAVFAKQSALLLPIIVVCIELIKWRNKSQVLINTVQKSTAFLVLSLAITLPWFVRNWLTLGMDFIRNLDGNVTLGERSWFLVFNYLSTTFEPWYLVLIVVGIIVSFLYFKELIRQTLLVYWLAVFVFIYFKNPHNYYTLPIIPISSIFISLSLIFLFSRIKKPVLKNLFRLFIIILICSSTIFTYRRFLNRKIGCDEVKQLNDFSSASNNPRIVYSLSGLYKAERYYIANPILQLKKFSDIREAQKTHDVYVYYRIEGKSDPEMISLLFKYADENKIIAQRKYSVLLKKKEAPIYQVFKFNKLP